MSTVAATTLTGRPVAISSGADATVRVWDLTTGRHGSTPSTGHTDTVEAVTTTMLAGRPVAVTLSTDKTTRIWDLTTGQQTTDPYPSDRRWTPALTATRHGRPVTLTGGTVPAEQVKVWDVTTGQQVGELRTWGVHTIAAATVDNQPVAVTSIHRTARVWDLTTGRQIGPELLFPQSVTAVTVSPHGHIVVCFGADIAVLTREPTPAKGA